MGNGPGLAIHLVDQVTESSGGNRRVTEGEIDHVTAVEGIQNTLSSRRATPGR